MSKYKNTRVVIDGVTFDSKAESRRYLQLLALAKCGEITDLELQVPYILAPAVKLPRSKRAKPALRYVCDFRYLDRRGDIVIEDVKGMVTDVFLVKEHLMATIHGLFITVVQA